jgi:methylamine--corrinoid protein Co-methyltransferase
MIDFVEVIERARTGKIYTPEQWDTEFIPGVVRELLKKYRIEKTYDSENPISSDDALADAFFDAGLELAERTGFYCETTRRAISFTRDEILEAMGEKIPFIVFGSHPDQVTMWARHPEDSHPPFAFLGPLGQVIDEEIWQPVHQSVAQYRVVDGIVPGSLEKIKGKLIRTGSPLETLAGHHEAVLLHQAVEAVGRSSMPLCGVETSPAEYGHFGGFGTPGGYTVHDCSIILSVSELRTTYGLMHKATHLQILGAPIFSGHRSMIGGNVGSPEGCAVTAVTAVLLQILVHRAHIPGGSTFDIRFLCDSSRESIWADCISGQAQSRHITRPLEGMMSVVGGACTDMLLDELISRGVALVVSGRSCIWGVRTGGGARKNRATGLESKFAAETLKAAAGMTRKDANDLVKNFIPKYESFLKKPQLGKPFNECFDSNTLQPTDEWKAIYLRKLCELEDAGMKIK